MRITKLDDVRAAAAAGRGRRVRRRPPRAPRGDRGSDTVLTFEPHPLQVVRPEAAPKLLTSLDTKAELIGALGVEELVVIPFDEGFADQSPQEFIDEVLVGGLGPRTCRWGRTSASATARRATRRCCRRTSSFETRVVPLVEVDGEIVSSSHIRGLVLAGEVEPAARFLGAPFQLRGEVVRGRPARPRARLPDRQHRSRRGARLPGPRRLRSARRRRLRGGQRRRAAHVRHRPGRAGRGLPARPARSTSTGAAADRVPPAAAGRAALRIGRGAGRADAPRRRAHARSCAR